MAVASLAGIRAGSAALVAFPGTCFRAPSGVWRRWCRRWNLHRLLTVAGAAQAGLCPCGPSAPASRWTAPC